VNAPFKSVGDSFINFLKGFGLFGRDPATAQHWALKLLDASQLEYAYRSDWLARKIVTVPAFDQCRAWRQWEGTDEQIKQMEEAERMYGLQHKLMHAVAKARLYGGAALVLGVDQGKFNEELNVEKVKKGDLKFVHVCTRYMLGAGPLIRDITSPYFGYPSYYMRANIQTPLPPGNVAPPETFAEFTAQDLLYIHPSRVVRLIGLEYPDLERAVDPWGDSVLQPIADALKDAGMVSSSIAVMISEAKLDVIKVPGLTAKMATEDGTNALVKRFAYANSAKSVINALLLDKEEEWDRSELQLSTVDRVLQMYLLVCCGAADIPATRMLGREPAGQNATGESDIRNYYDRLASDQTVTITPAMTPLDEVLIRSTFGDRPEGVRYNWRPLWQMTDAEKADIILKKSQAFQVDNMSGLFDPIALLKARTNQLIDDGVYPGMQTIVDEADGDISNPEPEPVDDPAAGGNGGNTS